MVRQTEVESVFSSITVHSDPKSEPILAHLGMRSPTNSFIGECQISLISKICIWSTSNTAIDNTSPSSSSCNKIESNPLLLAQ